MITSKLFKILKNADTVLNISYLTIKLPNLKLVDEKLLELEPRVCHSFDIKTSLAKKTFKSFGVHSNPLPVKFFLYQNLVMYMRYHNIFFR